jgi:hypothetical protein
MNDLRCARCQIEWYYIKEKAATDPDYAVLAKEGMILGAADVIYEGRTLCVKHLIGHIRLQLRDAPLEALDG